MNIITKLSRREREKLQRRNEIFEAAKNRFFQENYDNVSMDDIADDVELSKATLYLYFENKVSLFFSVVIKGMIILRDMFKESMEKETKGIGKIMSIIRTYYDYIQTHADYYRLNLSARAPRFTKLMQKDHDGETKIKDTEKYIKLTQDLLSMTTDAVRLGIKDGTIRNDLDPIEMVMFLGSAIEDSVYISPEYKLLLDMYGITEKEHLKHSIDILLNGIAGEKNKIDLKKI